MSDQPPDPEIEKFLAELRSHDPRRRQTAAEKVAKLRLQSDEIIRQLKLVAETDSNWYAKHAAANALETLAKPLIPLSRQAKIVQFTIGFVGWFLANWLTWLALTGGQGLLNGPGPGVAGPGIVWGLVLFPINLIVLIVLAVIRPVRWVALGMLSAIALNLVIALVLGLTTAGWCFIPFFTPGLR